MRIACVYLPSFPLQAHVRQAPHLANLPVAITVSTDDGLVIRTCSRSAWAEGVRPGMPAATARIIAPDLQLVTSAPSVCEQVLDAIVDSLIGICDEVDVGTIGTDGDATSVHRAIYVPVPTRNRAAAFGQKLLNHLSRQGLRARVGIADDRFTAHIAAVTVQRRGRTARLDADGSTQAGGSPPPVFQQACEVVPRGGSAAFLAPLPLNYLSIDSDVQNMLQTRGIKTVGDFAALPPPSVSQDWSDVDFWGLARGRGPRHIRGIDRVQVLERMLCERLELDPNASMASELELALRTLSDRVAQRLEGRGRMAKALVLRVRQVNGDWHNHEIPLSMPLAAASELFAAASSALTTPTEQASDAKPNATADATPNATIDGQQVEPDPIATTGNIAGLELEVSTESDANPFELQLFDADEHTGDGDSVSENAHAEQGMNEVLSLAQVRSQSAKSRSRRRHTPRRATNASAMMKQQLLFDRESA